MPCRFAIAVATLIGVLPVTASAVTLVEPPSLATMVKSGKLPPVTARVPQEPLVVHVRRDDWRAGQHGGTLTLLMSRAKDIRMMVVYGYTRLVGFNKDCELVPDVLRNLDVEEGCRFTPHLKKGHPWSDGHLFTAEGFRYYWEDVANNKMLSPVGPPRALMVNGEGPNFETLDKATIRFTWSQPNPGFYPRLPGQDCFIFIVRLTI